MHPARRSGPLRWHPRACNRFTRSSNSKHALLPAASKLGKLASRRRRPCHARAVRSAGLLSRGVGRGVVLREIGRIAIASTSLERPGVWKRQQMGRRARGYAAARRGLTGDGAGPRYSATERDRAARIVPHGLGSDRVAGDCRTRAAQRGGRDGQNGGRGGGDRSGVDLIVHDADGRIGCR